MTARISSRFKGKRAVIDRAYSVKHHMTKVAVIGVGHLGKQHARLYSELPGVELTGLVDIQEARAGEIADLYKTTPFTEYRALFGRVDAVSLAVPTVDHAR